MYAVHEAAYHTVCKWTQHLLHLQAQSSSLSNLHSAVLNHQKVALERLATEVKYPSMYRNCGCKEIYSFDMIGEQQEKSQYISNVCPVNKVHL